MADKDIDLFNDYIFIKALFTAIRSVYLGSSVDGLFGYYPDCSEIARVSARVGKEAASRRKGDDLEQDKTYYDSGRLRVISYTI